MSLATSSFSSSLEWLCATEISTVLGHRKGSGFGVNKHICKYLPIVFTIFTSQVFGHKYLHDIHSILLKATNQFVIQAMIQIPDFKFVIWMVRIIKSFKHLNYGLVKVCNLNGYATQISGIQIVTVQLLHVLASRCDMQNKFCWTLRKIGNTVGIWM